jgi:hypothetical protein
MNTTPRFLLTVLLTVSAAFAAPPKLEDWTDTQGQKFRGEPSEVLGPIALFRTGPNTGRRVAFTFLEPKDCVRFHRVVSQKPARAESWEQAKSDLTVDLRKRVMRVSEKKLVPADLSGRPEPLFYILFYVSSGEGPSWEMMGTAIQPYWDLQKNHPGMVEGVMVGLRHKATDHTNMATSMNVPWLVASFYEQSSIEAVRRFTPGEGYLLMIVSRNGVPIFSAQDPNKEAVTKTLADLGGLLDLMRPDNPKSWPARVHYLAAVQQATHANGKADPVLVGNPLRPEGLVQRKVYGFEATLAIAADGAVKEVALAPSDSLPEKMVEPLKQALQKAVFVPAVENGNFVDGVYTYRFSAEQR